MGTPDLGPIGCWRGALALVILGICSLIYLIVKGVIWLFNHVSIDF